MTDESAIYCITNLVNGHKYIGSTVNIRKRWCRHKEELSKNSHHSKYLQNAWNKYGAIYFEFFVLEYCEKERLIEREQFYIDNEKPAYNIAPAAGSPLGVKWSDETKQKVSGKNNHNFGKRASTETKRKLSEAHKGERHVNFGKHLSNETKQKISEAVSGERNARFGTHPRLGIPLSDETKQKLSDAHKGILFSEEHKRKISESLRKYQQKRKAGL